MPPSTGSTWPVMYDAASDAKKTNAPAISDGLRPALHRDAVHHVGRELLVGADGFGHRRRGQRRQRVDHDVLGGQFAGQRLGEADDARLGGRVVDLPERAGEPGRRRDVDDRARCRRSACRAAPPACTLNAPITWMSKAAGTSRRVSFGEHRRRGHARVVDHDVQRSVGRAPAACAAAASAAARSRHVQRARLRPAARVRNAFGHRGGRVGVDVGDEHGGARISQRRGDRGSRCRPPAPVTRAERPVRSK